MSTSTTTDVVTGSPLAEIERALTAIVRWGNLPRVRERFVAAAGLPLDRASYRLLSLVDRNGPIRLSDLAQEAGVDLSTASRQVHALMGAGLMQKTAVEEDRRAALLSVTRQGHKLLERLRAAKRAVLTEMLADWTPAQRDELATVLGRFADEMVAFGCQQGR